MYPNPTRNTQKHLNAIDRGKKSPKELVPAITCKVFNFIPKIPFYILKLIIFIPNNYEVSYTEIFTCKWFGNFGQPSNNCAKHKALAETP